jgi:hypothetical protein
MAADCASPFENPVFVVTLSAPDLAGVMAHEVMQPDLQLHTRRGIAAQPAQHMACDYATHPLLECGRIDSTVGTRH